MDKDGDGRLNYGDLKSYMNYAGLVYIDNEIKAIITFVGCNSNSGIFFDRKYKKKTLNFLKLMAQF